MLMVLLMLCLVFLGTAATYAVPAQTAGIWGGSYDMLPSFRGWLASTASGAVRWLAYILEATGVWAIIGGGIWYALLHLRRDDYSTKTRWYGRYALFIAFAGVIALLVGKAMLRHDLPGQVYLSVLLHMMR